MASSPQPTAQAAHSDLAVAPATPQLTMASLILGIASCIPGVGVLFCIPAIICGHLALGRARHASQPVDTRIVVGLTLGYVIAVIYAWMIIGLFVVPALSGR
jgi:hypothetical protein